MWGQPVVIDNRPGAGAVVGMEIAARASPDGYTIVQGCIGPTAIDSSIHSKLSYHPLKDSTAHRASHTPITWRENCSKRSRA